jgi:ABC-type nitrate/sulfonate/bicarbonate transport system substrate-binding protein/heme exporter protein D
VLTLSLLPSASRAEATRTKVTLQLKWTHQFQFAGYYIALEDGLYAKAGLDLTILPGGPKIDVLAQVLAKKADFGVGTSALLLDFAAGKRLVVLGVVYQHSPLVLLMTRRSRAPTLRELIGKSVMVEPQSADIFAMLEMAGVRRDQIKVVPHSGHVDGLLQGTAAAITAYITDEPYLLDKKKHPYTIFNPRSHGIDFYGDNFFTRKELLDSRPELVERFRDATIEGWKRAVAEPERAIKLIHDKYSTRKTLAHLRFEAQRSTYLMTDLVSPGHMNRRRWEYIASSYRERGLLRTKPNLDAFLYVDKRARAFELPRWFWPALGGGLLLLAISLIVSVRLKRLNRSLQAEVARRRAAEVELRAANSNLTKALDEIQALKGILPICSYCNSIRDESDDWLRLEEYICSRTEAEFSHGICPACYAKHHGQG